MPKLGAQTQKTLTNFFTPSKVQLKPDNCNGRTGSILVGEKRKFLDEPCSEKSEVFTTKDSSKSVCDNFILYYNF